MGSSLKWEAFVDRFGTGWTALWLALSFSWVLRLEHQQSKFLLPDLLSCCLPCWLWPGRSGQLSCVHARPDLWWEQRGFTATHLKLRLAHVESHVPQQLAHVQFQHVSTSLC